MTRKLCSECEFYIYCNFAFTHIILSENYKLVKEQLKPVNSLYKLKKWIEDRGLKQADVTHAPRPNAEQMILTLGLSNFFRIVVLGSNCEHAKPFPDAYSKVFEILNVFQDNTFVFEDSVSGIKVRVASGMSVIGFTIGNLAHLLMEANPAFLIKDYEDPKLWKSFIELESIIRCGEEVDDDMKNIIVIELLYLDAVNPHPTKEGAMAVEKLIQNIETSLKVEQ
ncbi:unnamed protein product [Fraxinus pennsylvanica]|uniref:Uncharacterized protein n=1 Tax=Fraxinus pennsylvanica TaxID=56036 RepID=A0AAD1ZUH1_9LAMI|nr:unnamed protein product [Fraxinus pennsylvanica]